MTLHLPYRLRASLPGLLSLICLSLRAYAGSAPWNLNPTNGDWNMVGNWTPATVPNATTDIATFDASKTTLSGILGGRGVISGGVTMATILT